MIKRLLICFLVVGGLFGCAQFGNPIGPSKDPLADSRNDTPIILRLMDSNGIKDPDGNAYNDTSVTGLRGVLVGDHGDFTGYYAVDLRSRKLNSFQLIQECANLKGVRDISVSGNLLTEIPKGLLIRKWNRFELDSNMICSPPDSPEKQYLDSISPGWESRQICK